MKVLLYMAVTPNGIIAGKKDDTSWVGEADWNEFLYQAKKAGNVVLGSRTYEAMKKEKRFPVPGVLNVVMTKRVKQLSKNKWDNVIFTNDTPRGVLKHLLEKGYKKALIAGGGKISGSFIGAKLITDLYLTIEPVVIGRGTKIFDYVKDFSAKLKFIESVQISDHEIQLRYRVL